MKHLCLSFSLIGIRLSELTFSSPLSFLLLLLFLLFSRITHFSFSPFPSLPSPANASPSLKSITFLLGFWFPIFLFLLLLIYADDPYYPLCHTASILPILFLCCPDPFLFLIKKDCLFDMHRGCLLLSFSCTKLQVVSFKHHPLSSSMMSTIQPFCNFSSINPHDFSFAFSPYLYTKLNCKILLTFWFSSP